MKIKTLEDQYILSYNLLKVVMPLASIIFLITGVVLAIALKEVWWGGLILIGIGGLTLVEFIFIRKYLLKKIDQLKSNESVEAK
ncbi:MAG: hypothetical protein K2N42_01560, partial [Anaeroplasmataceae bacterium]|nr:hypothetical protein [Anaeroplasmataceae bacterium]